MGGVRNPAAENDWKKLDTAMECGKSDMGGVRKPTTAMECGKSDMAGVRKPTTAMECGKSDIAGVRKPVTPIFSALADIDCLAASSSIAATANNFTIDNLRVFIFSPLAFSRMFV
jgi:hypothetical protein